jgi:hypothetical protein
MKPKDSAIARLGDGGRRSGLMPLPRNARTLRGRLTRLMTRVVEFLLRVSHLSFHGTLSLELESSIIAAIPSAISGPVVRAGRTLQ